MSVNRLPVVTGPATDALLGMLKARRFDYLHRGVTEIYAELADCEGSGALMVEPHLALHYPLPVHFMTRPDRQPLLQRLQRGLQRARQDGSWNRLIEQHMGRDWARARMNRRHVLELVPPWPAMAVPIGTP
jgi:hypothetical protein